jgi:phage shock protein PspC (stress-responsive transcriptional regulator)
MIAGVCGGIARHLGVDSTLVRVVAVVLAFAGGAGVLAYIAAVLLIPRDQSAPPAVGSDSTLRVVGVVLLLLLAGPLVLGAGLGAAGLLLPLAVLALMGLAVWWLVSGEGPGGDAKDVARCAALGVGVLFLCGLVAVGGGLAAGLGGGTLAAALVIGAWPRR